MSWFVSNAKSSSLTLFYPMSLSFESQRCIRYSGGFNFKLQWTNGLSKCIHLIHMHPISNIELQQFFSFSFFLFLCCVLNVLLPIEYLHFIYTIQHLRAKTIQICNIYHEMTKWNLYIFSYHFSFTFFWHLFLSTYHSLWISGYFLVLGAVCYWWLANRHIWWWTVGTIDICKSKIW